MCIGIPMRVIADQGFRAICEGRGQTRLLDMMLVGPQPAGTWVLAFLDHARSVLEPDAVAPIEEALDALEAVLRGDGDAQERLARLTAPQRFQPPYTAP